MRRVIVESFAVDIRRFGELGHSDLSQRFCGQEPGKGHADAALGADDTPVRRHRLLDGFFYCFFLFIPHIAFLLSECPPYSAAGPEVIPETYIMDIFMTNCVFFYTIV